MPRSRTRRRGPAPRLRLAVLVLSHRGRVLLARRPDAGLFAGMWGPPTVELQPGEAEGARISAAIALEPFGITGGIAFVGTVERQLTHRRLELLVHAGRLARPPASSERWRLVPKEDLVDVAIPAALRAALEAGLDPDLAGGPISRHRLARRPLADRLPAGGRR